MKKSFLAGILPFFLIFLDASGQYSRYIIRLRDKNLSPYSLKNPAAYLSGSAIRRRVKYKISLDSTDLPVNPAYLDSIRSVPNVQVLNLSKWLNQVCIKTTDPAALARISSFPFVVSNNPIAPVMQPGKFLVPDGSLSPGPLEKKRMNRSPLSISGGTQTRAIREVKGKKHVLDYFNYGTNYAQVHIHQGEYLHNLGFHGEGITIAILDAGFYNYPNNPAFDSLLFYGQVLGTWDYVNNKASVAEEHPHGAWCLSTMAANSPGLMVGTAPKAKFWLLKTEDVNSEYPVEEQNWAAAAEFADSAGVDMISSSLGYSYFDDPAYDLTHALRDGKTSIISQAAAMAVRKGILVTNSAGNSGNSPDDNFVICPADADSVVSVGAVDVYGTIGKFSSIGPNGAGHLKPNVVSVGVNAVIASSVSGNPVYSSGTSFSNPNLCGLIACLWQAFPEFSNMEIKDAVERSADRYNHPDEIYGNGIPNMKAAYDYLQTQRILRSYGQILNNGWLKAYPVPFVSQFNVLLKAPSTANAVFRLFDMQGKLISSQSLSLIQGNYYPLQFSHLGNAARGVYSLYYSDGHQKAVLRIIKQ
jgi:serine protease AprX